MPTTDVPWLMSLVGSEGALPSNVSPPLLVNSTLLKFQLYSMSQMLTPVPSPPVIVQAKSASMPPLDARRRYPWLNPLDGLVKLAAGGGGGLSRGQANCTSSSFISSAETSKAFWLSSRTM